MSKNDLTFANMPGMAGEPLGTSEWIVVDQTIVNQFADCTGDHQWIHVDVDRAKKESPFGGPIAHGYLTLSLLAALSTNMGIVPQGTAAALNYGLDSVRFIAPVKVGSKVRLHVTLKSLEPKGPGQFLMKTENTMEIEGSEKPALVAESLALLVAGPGAVSEA